MTIFTFGELQSRIFWLDERFHDFESLFQGLVKEGTTHFSWTFRVQNIEDLDW